MFYPPLPWLLWLTSSLQVTASLFFYITRHTKKNDKNRIKFKMFFENIFKKKLKLEKKIETKKNRN